MNSQRATDVLIVGAGIIGLSIARELRKRGVRKLRVIEKGQPGRESSWAAAGILAPQVEAKSDGEFFRLCLQSHRMFRDFAAGLFEETGKNIEYLQDGVLCVGFDEDDETEFQRIFDWQAGAGLNVEQIGRDGLKRLEPQLNERAACGLFYPDNGQVENRMLINALAAFASANDIVIEEGSAVSEITREDGHISVTTSAGYHHAAKTVVLATGAWTSLIKLPETAVPIKVKPMKGQMVSYYAAKSAFRVVYSNRGYVVPRRDGRLLVGATVEDVGFDKSTTDAAESMLTDIGSEIIPSLRALRIAESWSGLRPYVEGGEPFIGAVPGYEDLFAAVGHFRNGILLSPVTAKLIADQICN
jgi:glycine oxidase